MKAQSWQCFVMIRSTLCAQAKSWFTGKVPLCTSLGKTGVKLKISVYFFVAKQIVREDE